MFGSIRLVNFKSFTDVIFDFAQKNNNRPKNLVSIYGENGSGKTNIVDSFKILKFSTLTTMFADQYTEFQTSLGNDEKENVNKELLNNIKDMMVAINYRDIKAVLKNSPRINANDNTKLVYNFILNGISGTYSLEYDNKCNLISESLYYLLNQRRGTLFNITREEKNVKSSLSNITFKLNSQHTELKELINKLWGKHTFLSIFKQYQENVNEEYVNKNVSHHFIDILNEIDKVMIWADEIKGPFSKKDFMLMDLDSGTIKQDQIGQLLNYEEVIYSYFSALYSDIKDVSYHTKERKDSLDYQLFIHKNIGGELTEIPFYLESNGTKNLLELLQAFFWVVKGNIVIVDEIDAGIHDVLMTSIIKNIRENISGQLIFTTHDTILLRDLPASSAYFINQDSMGNKIILSGNDYEKKVFSNNNMQKMYLDGLFNAIPDPLDIDFHDIFESLNPSEV